MAGLNGDWYEALKGEFSKPYYRKLFETVKQEYSTHLIFPPADDIFNAFHLTPLKEVKVVILGQDPLSQSQAGPWSVFFCTERRRDSAVTCEHLSGAAR